MGESENQNRWKIPLVLALLATGLYAANTGDYFRSDDFVYLSGVDCSPVSFFTGENLSGTPFYRPATLFFFWLDRALWGFSPIGFHVTNLLLSAAVTALYYLLVSMLFVDRRIALMAAFIFAAHPARADSVAWISGRTDLVCAILLLGSLTLFTWFRSREKGFIWVYSASLILGFAALFAKENALMLPLVVLGSDFVCEPARLRAGRIRWIAPFFVITLLYIAIRTAVLHGVGGYGAMHLQFGLFVARNLFTYLQFFILPADLSGYADFIYRHQLILAVVMFAVIAVPIYFLRKKLFSRAGIFGLFIAVLAFIPVGNLYPQNRHSLVIHLGLAIFPAAFLAPFLEKKNKLAIGTLAVFGAWAMLCLGLSLHESRIANRASFLAKQIADQTAAVVDRMPDPVTVVAVALPDTYQGAFVFRNGLHQALSQLRPDRKVIAHQLAVVGMDDLSGSGLRIIQKDTNVFEAVLPEMGGGYILLPDAIRSRHLGDTTIIGPVGYRIVDESRLFRVNGIEMVIDKGFLQRKFTAVVTFENGRIRSIKTEE